MRLTVGIDLASLPSYVALAPILALRDDCRVDIEWLPLSDGLSRLSARQPGDAGTDPLAGYKARRRQARDQWARRQRAWDCERLGIPFELGEPGFDSTMGALGILYLADRGGDISAYLEAAFARVFRQAKPLHEHDVAALVGAAEFHSFVAGDGPARLEALQSEMLEQGIYESPAFVLEGEVLQGRQHLPLIRWRLGGGQGTPPV